MARSTTGPGGNTTPISVPNRAPYDAIERGSFLFRENPVFRQEFLETNFSIELTLGIEDEVLIPVNPDGKLMSPVEKSTGVPLPILPSSDKQSRYDEHHTYFYKQWYANTPDTAALRYSRIQMVGREDHNRFHELFDGTLPPETERDLFRVIIMNCAGYVPAYGVHMQGEKTTIRPLRHHERQSLRAPGTFYPDYNEESPSDTNGAIGKFIARYALAQAGDKVEINEVKDFIKIPLANRELKQKKFEMGMQIASKLIDSVVSDFREDYTQAHESESFMPHPGNGCPVSVAEAQVKQIKRSVTRSLHIGFKERVAV